VGVISPEWWAKPHLSFLQVLPNLQGKVRSIFGVTRFANGFTGFGAFVTPGLDRTSIALATNTGIGLVIGLGYICFGFLIGMNRPVYTCSESEYSESE